MPEISIIIPNYNTAQYLPRCLDSLINQTFQDIEILVIDDGSTDGSVKIMESYHDPKVHVLHHKGDGSGPGGARNMGLDAATGRYIMFCDSDDWYEPDMCQKMYEAIKREKVDVVCCQNFFDHEDHLSQAEIKSRHSENYHNNVPFTKSELNQKKILDVNVLLWNKIWRRDLIEQYKIRFIPNNPHDDDAFWYMYGSIARSMYYLKKKLYHYFLRTASIMSNNFHKKIKNKESWLEICLAVFQFLKDTNKLQENSFFMKKVFERKMKFSALYLPKDEVERQCEILNKIIKSDLKSSDFLMIVLNGVFLIKPDDKWRLWIKLCVFYVKKWVSYWRKKEKYEKYQQKTYQIKTVLKVLKNQ